MPKLTDRTIKTSKIGGRSDSQAPGLSLITQPSTSKARPNAKRRSWMYRFTLNGKREKMGLGPYPAVTLEEAHRKWRKAAAQVAKGLDPRLARHANPENLSFREAADAYLMDALPRFSSAKTRSNFEHALRVHAQPFHDRPVLEIGTRDVATRLKAIAAKTPGRAKKVRAALHDLFAHVVVSMEDQGVVARNPVMAKSLRHAGYIPVPSHAHHPALDPAEAPEFMAELRAIPSMDARLLEFTILTVARAGAARAARFDQIVSDVCRFDQIVDDVWIVPPDQLKDGRRRKGRPLRVPLSPRALAIVDEMRALHPDAALIFDGAHDMTLINFLRRMNRARAWHDPVSKKRISVHGFRSTFRTWCQNSRHDREVTELAMGHRFHGAVESAYARGDLLDERRALLNDWSNYLDAPPAGANIIAMRRA
jgi:integrase